jgi:membrane associated rhomboid family serine protease
VSTSQPAPRRSVADVLRPVLVLLGLMWALELVDLLLAGTLDTWGIRGRTIAGLPGIVLAPFLHGGVSHLAANTLPFLVLGALVAWRSADRFVAVLAVIVVVGGLGVWLLTSPSTVTIGASGMVFGFGAYLVAAGVLTRHWLDVLVAVVVVLGYASMLPAVLPFGVSSGVSWLGHLTGALAGVLAAMLLARRG